MGKIYLFDWGDTLMLDNPNEQGKMCNWREITLVKGALETLQAVAQHHQIYIATNAADSTEHDIKLAFKRAGLAPYVTGYFCKANLGIGKGSADFYHKIIQTLNVNHNNVVMVGDSFKNDIAPAIEAGIEAIWFNPNYKPNESGKMFKQIHELGQLCFEFV